MEDTLEGLDDEEEMEEAAEAEVDRILYEITAGKEIKFLHRVFCESLFTRSLSSSGTIYSFIFCFWAYEKGKGDECSRSFTQNISYDKLA